jgi:hypothetical protein
MLLPDIQILLPRGLTPRLCPEGSHGGGERAEAVAAAPTRHQDTIDKGHEEAGAYYYAHHAAHNCPRGEAAGPAKPARGRVGGGAIPALLSEGLFSGQSIQMQVSQNIHLDGGDG